jgi:hypothetical protein
MRTSGPAAVCVMGKQAQADDVAQHPELSLLSACVGSACSVDS